ncbi:MAG: beta-lactamase family protein [Hyphomonadaceae bacterium JAD_PAG50586_4]|nr:MAG: beta-lactamase family protein [Hyphomonadaceae bacterium JAD_PAG50586_4]
MQRHSVPGLAIAVVEDADLAWQGHYGVTNIETGSAVTERTLFQAASLSKPIFSYVVMKLVEEGRLDLDSRLADYILPSGRSDHPRMKSVTVRNVLSHSTGLPNWRDEAIETAEFAPAFEPGTAYSYSGEAFYWLQQVVEAITGAGVGEIISSYLLRRAGLEDMAMLWTPERDAREVYGHAVTEGGQPLLEQSQFRREHMPRLHEVGARWGRPPASWTHHDLRVAHGVMRPHTVAPYADRPLWLWNLPGNAAIDVASSIRTTVGDYARFMTLMMASRRSSRRWQISESSRQLMLTPQLDRPNRPLLPPGLGWGLERREDGNLFHHWGRNGAAHVSVALGDPMRRRGLVVMVNGSQGAPLVEEIVVAMTGMAYASIV